jgi:allantoinase
VEQAERGEAVLIIRNGQVALPGETDFKEVDILIEGERIAAIGKALPDAAAAGGHGSVDARGIYVLPGGIDPHVHFDDPGYTSREDFYRGSCAAASGGITTVIDMPDTCIPPVINDENLKRKIGAIESKAVVDYGLYGGVSAQSFENGFPGNMESLCGEVLGYKSYFISGMDSFGRLDHYQFKQVLTRASGLGLPVLLHAEDYGYVTAATENAMQEGGAPIHYYNSRPETAEMLAALCAVRLAEESGADLHIVHIGTADVCDLLSRDTFTREHITGETGPQYLEFDVTDFEAQGARLKCTPPLKGPGNREKLWRHLSEGVLSFAASDHAPCTPEEKNTGSIWTDYAGIPGCPTLLPYLFSEGFLQGRLSLPRLLQVVAENAARRYGLFDRKGSIEPGKHADFAFIDPARNWTVRGEELLSKGSVTPFENRTFSGRVVKTMVRGTLVYSVDKGVLVDGGYGAHIKKQ